MSVKKRFQALLLEALWWFFAGAAIGCDIPILVTAISHQIFNGTILFLGIMLGYFVSGVFHRILLYTQAYLEVKHEEEL